MTQNNTEQSELVERAALAIWRSQRDIITMAGEPKTIPTPYLTMAKAALSTMPQPVAEQSLQNKDACSEPCVRRLSEDAIRKILAQHLCHLVECDALLTPVARAILAAQRGQAVAPDMVALVKAARRVYSHIIVQSPSRIKIKGLEDLHKTLQPFTGVKADE